MSTSKDVPEQVVSDDDAVAVVGMGIVVPGADSPERFWELLCRGEPMFSEPGDRYPQENFWAAEPGEQDRTYAPKGGYVRISDGADLASGWLRKAILQALPESFDAERTELFVGACADGNQHLEQALVVEGLARRLTRNWPSRTGDQNALTERLRSTLRAHYRMDDGKPASHLPDGVAREAINGALPETTPYTVIDTACSSSLYALDLGAKKLLDGECDLALCGGQYMVSPRFNILFSKLHGLSRSGAVRTFDDRADGTLLSDGAAVVALRRLADARRRGDQILGLLAGFGAAADGKGKAIYAPNLRGQELALRRAFEVNQISPRDVAWVIAHGTGTPAGDGVELRTLNTVFEGEEVLCTSNKSLIGHTGWPAGVASVIHALLGLRHGVVPAQHQVTDLAAEATASAVRVPMENTALHSPPDKPRTVGVSGFGFGGTNAHQVVQEPMPVSRPPRCQPPRLDDEIVLVAWSAYLPGEPSIEDIRTRLRGGESPAEATGFGSPMPLPGPKTLRIPPATAAVLDRTQIMALAVAEQFATQHGELWAGIEDLTGVVAAHYGPALSWAETSLRCYADDLLTVSPGADLDTDEFAAAAKDCVAQIRAEVHPTTPDTQPGLMGNVIPARIANRYNLHGPVLLADTGPSSSLAAIDVACRYLRSGQMNLALVLALNGNSSPELATLLGNDGLAEGAFLLALARRGDAEREGWPVLCEISTTTPITTQQGTTARSRSYLAADGVIDLIAELERIPQGGTATVTSQFPAPQVNLTVPTTSAHNRRYVNCLVEEPATPAPVVSATPGADWLVVVQRGSEGVLPQGLADSGATVLVVDGTRPHDDQFTNTRPFRHIRVIGMLDTGTWPGPPTDEVLALHEMLFLAARACRDQLAAGGSLGVHLRDPLRRGVPHPDSGLFTGIMRSLAWELSEAQLAVVLSDGSENEAWARLHDELTRYRGDPVTVWHGGSRQRFRLTEVPVPPEDADAEPLQPGAVVVATGGARGITAACLEELARRVPLRVWLLGSSELEDVSDELLDANESELPGLRAAYLRGRRAEQPSATIPQLNAQFDRLLRARESQLTLRRLQRSCGTDAVRYLTCDVTDADAVHRVAGEIAKVEQSIDLLIHGAGLYGPADISRLTLERLRTIRDVKLAGYHHLREAFADLAPRRWCSFGSVTGLVGLPGETNYAPGNDFLTSAARYNTLVEGRDELGIAWPIWSETGMGGSELVYMYSLRNGLMTPMPPAEGVVHFADEIAAHRTSEPVVCFLDQVGRDRFGAQFPGFFSAERGALPSFLLGTPHQRDGRHARWMLDLNTERTAWLEQHLVKASPTAPGTALAAVAAEAAIQLRPHLVPVELRSLRFSSFVRPPTVNGRRPATPFHVDASLIGENEVRVVISADVIGPGGQVLRTGREHFSGTVVLGAAKTEHVARGAAPGAATTDPYYAQGAEVFLDGMFRATDAWLAGPGGSSARWRLPQPNRRDERVLALRPPIPVVLFDSLLRTSGLAADADGHQVAKVPRSIDRVELYVAGSDDVVARAHPDITLRHHAADDVYEAVGGNGRVLMRTSGCQLVALTGAPASAKTAAPSTTPITAAVAHEAKAEFVIRELELEQPRPGEIRVRVEASGVCHTDLLVRDQIYPPSLPAVLGHEGAGIVEEVGTGVHGIEPGDHVVVSFASCGICTNCLRGLAWCEQLLPLNFGGTRPDGSSPISHDGKPVSANFFGQSSFATHLVTSVRNVVRIPKDVPFSVAAPLGCGVQTGAGAVLNALRPPAGSSLVIFGAGSVGLSAVMAGRVVGCSTIIAVNRRPDRLRLAKDLGATHTIDGNATDVVEQILDITSGGADFVLESTGNQDVIASAVRALAMGGVCGLLTVPPPGLEIGVDMSHLLFGRTIKGIVEGDALPQILIPQLVALYLSGQLPVDKLVRTYRLDEINQAIADSTTGTTIKPVLLMR